MKDQNRVKSNKNLEDLIAMIPLMVLGGVLFLGLWINYISNYI